MSAHHVGNIGTRFVFTITEDDAAGTIVDLSSQTSLSAVFKTPSGTVKTFGAALLTDGTDGKLYYTTSLASDLDVKGRWERWAVVSIASGTFTSTKAHFIVEDNSYS